MATELINDTELIKDMPTLNQRELAEELKSAVIIKHLFKEILDNLGQQYDDTSMNRFKSSLMRAVDNNLSDMINADDHETYSIHSDRLENLADGLREKFSLQVASKESVDEYRIMREIHRAIQKTDFNDKEKIMERLPSECKEHPNFDKWQEKITALASQDSETAFKSQKSEFINDLISKENEKGLASKATLSLIKDDIHALGERRKSYLEKTTGRGRTVKNLAWIGAGSLAIVGAAVLSLAFPPLAIAGAAVAGGVLAYGATDVAKRKQELKKQEIQDKRVKRKPSQETKDNIKKFAKELGNVDADSLLDNKNLETEKSSKERKNIGRFGMALSSAGLVTAIVALAVALPMVAVPVGVLIAVASIAVAIAGVTAGLFGFKRFNENKKIKQCQTEVADKMSDDKKIFEENELKQKDQLDQQLDDQNKDSTVETLTALHDTADLRLNELPETQQEKQEKQVKQETQETVEPPEPLTPIENSPIKREQVEKELAGDDEDRRFKEEGSEEPHP